MWITSSRRHGCIEMAKAIPGIELLKELKKTFGVTQGRQLAKLTGYTTGRISQMQREQLDAGAVAKLITRSATASTKNHATLIQPIVEQFAVEQDHKAERNFIDTSKADRKELRELLKSSVGIYAFYNSELEVVYVGKTKNNLWSEMKQAFNRPMSNYSRYRVVHPRDRFANPADNIRPLKVQKFFVYNAAYFFSAYAVPLDFVDVIETLLIRVFSNDLINVQMAGNNSLLPYRAK
jgi:hypothetical protein